MGLSLLDARNGHGLNLRNLGINFIEHTIKSDQLEPMQLHSIKNEFWSLVFCDIGAFDPINEKLLLKDKVTICIAILACKLWVRPDDDPYNWNDFFDTGILESVLKSQSHIGSEHLRRQEFALLTISHLIEIIRTSTSSEDETYSSKTTHLRLSEERRLQLHSALEISLPPFTEWLFVKFPIMFTSKENFPVINAAVSCFRSFCTWMGNLSVDGLKGMLETFILILLYNDNDIELSINILDTLQLFFSIKHFSPVEQEVLNFYLESKYLQIGQLLTKFSKVSDSEDSEKSYQMLKLLTGCYFSIGNRYICNKKTPLIVKNQSEIISLFISIGQIPSLSIYLDMLELLTNMSKVCNLKGHIPQIFMLIAVKLGQSLKSSYKSSYFNEIDFEEFEEFKEFWDRSRVRSGELIKALTIKYPEQILEYSYNSLGTFIQQMGNTGKVNNLQWDGLLLIEDYISRGLEPSSYNQKCLLHLQLFMIHGPLPVDLGVLDRWITCVKNLTSLQGSQCPLEDFRRSVEKLFNLAICPDRPDQLRSHAASSILKLADSNVELFLPLLEPLLTAISPLLSSGANTSWERRLFSELILIFMSQPTLSSNQQLILFSAVTDPLVDLLKNAKAVLLSGQDPVLNLMKHIGFDELKYSNACISDLARKFSSELNLLLSILQILFKRIAPLVQNQPQSPVVQTCLQVLDELVGFLMLMIQSIHRIGTVQTWISYFGSDVEYLSIYPKMQEFLEIGDDSEAGLNVPVTTTSQSSPLVHIAGWTRHYRQTSYLVLGLAATSFNNNFFALPNIAERFMSQPLSSLESLNLADWSVLIKLLIKPVLISAPRELVPILVASSLNGLLVMLGKKLEQEWSLVFAANSSSKPATGAALALEMSRESKCNNLSNSFIVFLTELMNIPNIDNFKFISLLFALEKDNLLPQLESGQSSSLTSAWLFSEGPVDLIFLIEDFLGAAMMNWPRSVGVFSKLISLQIYFISGIMGRQDFPNLAMFLSKSINYALSCYFLPSWTDHQSSLLTLLTEQFKWSFLILANEYHSGEIIFDPDCCKFLKSFKCSTPSQFENELITRFKATAIDLQQLRTSILSNENLKSQRSSLRLFLSKNSKPDSLLIPNDFKQKELSDRLVEMKKRIGRRGNDENENFDSLLSDLFN